MYLTCKTRPDIAFVVGQLSRHNANLKKKTPTSHKKNSQVLKRDDVIEISI